MLKISRRRLLIGSGLGATAIAAGGLYKLAQPGGAIVIPGVSRARAITTDSTLPRRVDVVVIGGGFVGCATALTLAERGVSVALCEKGVIAGEASGRSLGWIDSLFLDPIKFELIARSKALWAEMTARVRSDIGYQPAGLMGLFKDAQELADGEAWLASVKDRPTSDGRLLSTADISKIAPKSSIPWVGAVFQPSDALAEARLAAPAIAEAAQRHGASILQHCAVRGIETSAGRINAVITELGPIETSAVVLCGGVWSPVFARSLGLELPQIEAYGSMLSIDAVPGPTASGWGNGVCWRRQSDGSYTICAINSATPITPATFRYLFKLVPTIYKFGAEVDPVFSPSTFWREWNIPDKWALDVRSPFEDNRIFQPEIRYEKLREVLRTLQTTFPLFANARLRDRWAGALVSTLDNMPVISPVASHPGLFLGTGFYYGLTMGPAAGEALADLVMGITPKVDLRPYRYERFVDGSTLEFRS